MDIQFSNRSKLSSINYFHFIIQFTFSFFFFLFSISSFSLLRHCHFLVRTIGTVINRRETLPKVHQDYIFFEKNGAHRNEKKKTEETNGRKQQVMHAQGTPLTHVRINPIDMNTENWDASVEASVIILSTPHHHYYTQQPTRSTSSTTSSPLFFWFTTRSFPFSRYTVVRFSVSFDLIGRGEGTPATPI